MSGDAGVRGRVAAGVVHLLVERSETLATVESLTGGLVAATIVEIAGVSSVYRGGLVVYATELKARLAGVPEDLLAARGPVDPDVALALAAGGRQR
ncbi:CinA family protein, partial [Micromonospora zhanjiangensis]